MYFLLDSVERSVNKVAENLFLFPVIAVVQKHFVFYFPAVSESPGQVLDKRQKQQIWESDPAEYHILFSTKLKRIKKENSFQGNTIFCLKVYLYLKSQLHFFCQLEKEQKVWGGWKA